MEYCCKCGIVCVTSLTMSAAQSTACKHSFDKNILTLIIGTLGYNGCANIDDVRIGVKSCFLTIFSLASTRMIILDGIVMSMKL